MNSSLLKNITEAIVIFFITLLIGFVACEGLLRLKNTDQKNYNIEMWRYAKLLKTPSKNPYLGHEHIQNSSAHLQGVEIKLNSVGMRGPEPDLADDRRKRILILGSSNTLGWGVEEKKIVSTLLQAKLNNEVQVFNGGIGNYNAVRYVTLFEEKLRELKPNIVVIHFFIRDGEILEPGGGNFILRHSQLAVLLHQLFYRLTHKTGLEELVTYYQKVYRENSQGRKEMERAFDRLNQLAQQQGFEVVFTVIPDIHALDPYPFQFIHDIAHEIAKRYGWQFLDFTPALKKIPSEELWALPGDPHLNAAGHEIMADALASYFKSRLNSE